MNNRFNGFKTRVFFLFLPIVLLCAKEIKLSCSLCLHFLRFFKNTLGERLKLQIGEDFIQFGIVWFFQFQIFHLELYRNIGSDGCQELRNFDILYGTLHFLAELAFHLGAVFYQSLYASKLVDEFDGCLLSNTRASREVVGRVTHQCQKIDNLEWGRDAVFLFNLSNAQLLVTTTMARSEHKYVVSYQLGIILIWCEHIGFYTHLACLQGNGTNDIIRLETIHLKNRNVISLQDILDDRYRELDVFRCLFSLCLIRRKSLVAEGFAMVESHRNMGWLLLGEYLVEGIAEAHYTRSIKSLRIDSRGFHKGIIRPINERICV